MPKIASLGNPEELLIATFELSPAGLFGVDATLIEEVVMVDEITPVHHAADYVAGIRNLRGRIITVIDLGVRLGLKAIQRDSESRILITDYNGEPVGLLVDRVADAIAVETSELEPIPANMTGAQCAQFRGVFRQGERLVALLHLAPVLSFEHRSGIGLTGADSRVSSCESSSC